MTTQMPNEIDPDVRPVERVSCNDLSRIYHQPAAFGWPMCGARFPRTGMARQTAIERGFIACRRCYKEPAR